MLFLKLKARIPPRVTRAARGLVRPLFRNDISLEKPVFVWGNGQSGTFLLYDLLALTGSFAYPWTEWPRKKGVLIEEQLGLSFPRGRTPNEGIPQCWSGVNVAFEKVGGWVFDHELSDSEVDTIHLAEVRNYYTALADKWPWKPVEVVRILDKCPNYIFMIAAIERLFPDALHIWCVRDPRLVLSSIVRRFVERDYESSFQGYPSGFYSDILLPGWETHRNEPLEVRHAWQVETCLAIAQRWQEKLGDRCLTVYHEDLCSRPGSVLASVATFLNIPPFSDHSLLRLRGAIRVVSPKAWPADESERDKCDAFFLQPVTIPQLTQIRELAVRLGYHPDLAGSRHCAGYKGGQLARGL